MSRKLLTNIRSHTIGFLYYLMAVLVAISIPIFTTQLEKSRDATTLSNVRAAYAEAQASFLTEVGSTPDVTVNKTNGKVSSIVVANVISKGTQTNSGFGSELPFDASGIQGLDNTPSTSNTLTFTYADNGTVSVAAS